jgi:hypothetical protein
MEFKPAFPVGTVVVASGNKRGNLQCIGKVVNVMTNSDFRNLLIAYHKVEPHEVDNVISRLATESYNGFIDPSDYIYLIQSTNTGKPTLPEVLQFIPNITDEQYEFLMSLTPFQVHGLLPQVRTFRVPESALLPYDSDLMQN